jgi:hypothetical protein
LIALGHHVGFEPIQVEVHLSGIGVLEGANLEIQQHVATQAAVEEDQIDAFMLAADSDAKLPRFETETGAQLQHEALQMIEQVSRSFSEYSARSASPTNSSTYGSRMISAIVCFGPCRRARRRTAFLFLDKPVRS